ncbi:hypothetical protein, partial [Actinobacillus pleuropneumoniae]|uniref:hypothetical protein n=1 Tax=Actinobacillus pleuropneumoniae TaxID=715 RepID=UPI00227B5275
VQILRKLACNLGLLCLDISEAIPEKIFKRNHHFNQSILKKETISQQQLIQKVSFQKHYKVGFGQIKFKSEPIKAPPYSLVTHLPLNTSR